MNSNFDEKKSNTASELHKNILRLLETGKTTKPDPKVMIMHTLIKSMPPLNQGMSEFTCLCQS